MVVLEVVIMNVCRFISWFGIDWFIYITTSI